MTDLPEGDERHEVLGPDYVPICAHCIRTVSLAGLPNDRRWEHDEPQYDVENP